MADSKVARKPSHVSKNTLSFTFEFVRTLAEKQSFVIYDYVKADRGSKIGSQR